LFIPQVIYEYGEPQWNVIDSEASKKNVFQCYFVHTNPVWTNPGVNPGLRRERPAINSLRHGTASTKRLFSTV
jgi:hypothetical protein